MRAALCFVTTLLILAVGSISFAAPDLQVDNPDFDFGKVFQGEKVLHVFEFVNAGDETLQINKVRSSCGCTAVLVSDKNIPPGGKGELKANFDSARFRNQVSKTIYLYSNDPARPVMQFYLKGTVLETVAIEPAQVNFGEVLAGKSVSATVLLRNQSEKPLTLGKPSSTAAELTAKIPGTALANGDEVTLELQLTAKPGQARFSGYVLVPVEGVPKNELRIPVYANIKNE